MLRRDALRVNTWEFAQLLDGMAAKGLDITARRASMELTQSSLRSAVLFWVSDEMSQLCADAAHDLDEAHLGRDLWPAEHGFMVFGTPLRIQGDEWRNKTDPDDEPIRALHWYPEEDRLTVLLHTDMSAAVRAAARANDAADDRVAIEEGRQPLRRGGARSRAELDRRLTDIQRATGGQWLMPAGGDEYRLDAPVAATTSFGSRSAGVLLSTVWLLMSQKGLASTRTGLPAPKNKAARKRTAAVQRDLDALRMIELRAGTDHAAAYTGTTSAYRHRWMVRGHWRQQWYPSLGLHRPVHIAPYLKGPADAPLLTGEKVLHWKGR